MSILLLVEYCDGPWQGHVSFKLVPFVLHSAVVLSALVYKVSGSISSVPLIEAYRFESAEISLFLPLRLLPELGKNDDSQLPSM